MPKASLWATFLSQTIGSLPYLTAKATTFSKMTENNGRLIMLFKVIQAHQFQYKSKALMRLSISE